MSANTEALNPELLEASPLFRDIASISNDMINFGVDPATALAIMASVPVALRVLRMVNELTSAGIEDWKGNKAIEREERRAHMRLKIRQEASKGESAAKRPVAIVQGTSELMTIDDADLFDEAIEGDE